MSVTRHALRFIRQSSLFKGRKDKLMKRTITMIFICAILAVSAFAQGSQQKPATGQPAAKPTDMKPADAKPAEALPSVDQILDKFVQAIGGKAAIEKVTSRVSKGTFEIPAMGAGGPIELYAKAPNKNLVIINIPGFGIVQQGYNGTVAWAQEPTSGLRELSGPELASAKREAEFYADIKFKELYPKMVVKGKDKVADKDVYVIEATPTEGSPAKLYFDAQSGLMVRTDREAETPQGKMPIEIYLENYKDVEGLKLPFTIRQITPAISFTIKIDDVKHNVPVEDAKFNKPSGQ
jgi:outer membrane lipoprotein-sorting protein